MLRMLAGLQQRLRKPGRRPENNLGLEKRPALYWSQPQVGIQAVHADRLQAATEVKLEKLEIAVQHLVRAHKRVKRI